MGRTNIFLFWKLSIIFTASVFFGCNASSIQDGGSFSDAGNDAGIDAGTDAGVDAGVDAGAQDAGVDGGTDGGGYCLTSQCFAVPPTGQTKCYDNSEEIVCPSLGQRDAGFWGQDAIFPKARTLTCVGFPCSKTAAAEGEVVTDSLTGLMWQRTFVSSLQWQGALDYCSALNYGGHQDWRLPNPMELASIVDRQKYGPSIDTTIFPGIPSGYFWSSSSGGGIPSYAWFVYFYYGYASYEKSSNYYYVRCVRLGTTFTSKVPARQREEASDVRFIVTEVTGQKVVTDTTTGLMWQYNYISEVSWQQALSNCATCNHGNFTDWRLPNANELLSLVNYSRYSPASDFPEMPSTYFWSSSSGVGDPRYAWDVDFNLGYVIGYSKNNYLADERCVRLGP